MNRKVILISGYGGLAFGQKEVGTFVEKLIQLDNIDLEVIGNGDHALTMDEISQSLDTVSPEQDVTIIIQSHGAMKNEFYFCMGDGVFISSKQLFQMFKIKFGNKPIDIFTNACRGVACYLIRKS